MSTIAMPSFVKFTGFASLALLLALAARPAPAAGPRLELLGQWPAETRGLYQDAAFADGHLAVAAASGGVQLFDLRAPDAPARAGELYGLPDQPVAVARDGDRAIAVGWQG
jgi:hypothetical protein